jgi:tetratricopeptide (TPR) repeat protein
MTVPGDETAAGAGGHRHLRASRADRERVIDELKTAFVHGRLDRDEFGLRVGRALESRTCADLAALTADLPAGPVPGPRPVKAVRARKAVAQYERVLADRLRTEGADHPDTIAARANLAYAYRLAKRFRDAIPQYERTLEDRIRVQGPDHPDTLTARSNLAACYQLACRLTEAIPQYKRALADSERMLGAGDTETLITRCNLASAYYTAGRFTEVIVVLRRALTDCERYLGADHQMTQTVRANLDAASQI